MSVQSQSVVELLGKLCDLHLGQTKRAHLVQPKTGRDVHFQRLRRKAFDTLFSFLKSPESKQSGVGAGGVRVEVDSVLQTVYQLRVSRRFQDADRLEHLLEVFLGSSSEECGSVLKLLVGLAGTGTPVPSSPLGHDTYNTPIISEDTKREVHLPGGPLCYGDYQDTAPGSVVPLAPFMHYPPQLFASHARRSALLPRSSHHDQQPPSARPVSIFTMLPGTGFESARHFSAEKESLDSYRRLTRMSLFGGLVQARDTSMAVRLDLPDLPDDPQACPPEITIPKSLSMSELSEDEGFVTTEGSSSATTPAESFVEEDIWELALTSSPCRNYVWERIGCEPMVTERPYLTEAGPQALDELCHLRQRHKHLLHTSPYTCASVPVSLLSSRRLSPGQLVKDIVYLLIGIPSRTFAFLKGEDTFAMDPGVSTSGMSPEALRSLTAGFVACGTHYRRLSRFAAAATAAAETSAAAAAAAAAATATAAPVASLSSFTGQRGSTYTKGLVLQAFKGGVRAALQHYRAAVLSLPTSALSLLALSMHCDKVVRQIRFLAELCHCGDRTPHNLSDDSFPLGVALISYLYQETVNAVNTDNYLLMLSLLRNTCQPFVMFVQDWVFHGTFRDVYGEFMIQTNHRFLEAKDETYWEQGYTLTTEDEASSVPTFLSHLASDIFRCGKALNLLRTCCPNHFLCGVSDIDIPRLSISYTRSDLRVLLMQCQMYVSRMQQVARQASRTRAQQQSRAEKAQRELLETARRMAAMEIARVQGILDARKQKVDEKKREEFKRLKDQLTADQQRRAGKEAEGKKEDQQFMSRLTRQEQALTQQDVELEKQARDELIAYYTDLGEEAAMRERRALWRIRRAQLETQRIRLLAADALKWKTELVDHRHAQGLLERLSEADPLPDWALKSLEEDSGATGGTLQVGGASQWDSGMTDSGKDPRDWSLPKWAEGHNNPSPPGSSATSQSAAGAEQGVDQLQGGRERGEEEDGSVAPGSSSPAGQATSTAARGGATAEEEEEAEAEAPNSDRSSKGEVEPPSSDRSSKGEAEAPSSDRSSKGEAEPPSLDRSSKGEAAEAPISDRSSEDRMPAWARRVLHQSTDSSVDAAVVVVPVPVDAGGDDDENDDAAGSNPATARSVGSDVPDVPASETEDTQDLAPPGGEVDSSGGSGGGGGDLVPEAPRTAGARTGIHMVEGVASYQQTEERTAKPHIQISDRVGASTESSSPEEARRHLRLVPGMSATTETESEASTEKTAIPLSKTLHATQETQESEQCPHLRSVADRNATRETQESEQRPHLRSVADRNATRETQESEQHPHLRSVADRNATQESQESKQRPHLRSVADRNATRETQESEQHPHLRSVADRNATQESQESEQRPHLLSVADRNATREIQESEQSPHLRVSVDRNATRETQEPEQHPHLRASVDRNATRETQESEQRPHLRAFTDRNATTESQESEQRPHLRAFADRNATRETQESEQRPHLRSVANQNATKETQESEQHPHLKSVADRNAARETQQSEQRPHLRSFADRNVNLESQDELRPIPRLGGSSQYNACTETSSMEWRVRKASLFGHISQLSRQELAFHAPRLKRQRHQHSGLESEFREFAVRPRIRMHKQRSATAETEGRAEDRPHIRSFKDRHANLESVYVDVEGIRRQRFLEHNVFGHSSNSTVQKLLYGAGFGDSAEQEMEALPELQQLVPGFELDALDLMPDQLETLDDHFDRLNGRPMVDLLASMPGVVQGGLGAALWQGELTQEEADLIALTPLPVLLQQALSAPLTAQISLVDQMVVNYFLVDLKMDSHFEALHRYLFMADGDFAQNLTDILLEKLSASRLPQEMLSPEFLNAALSRALQLSVSVSQQHADCLSFSLRYMPDFFKHNAPDTLDCLELRYKVQWPVNVVLTEGSQVCYGRVFSFMLQLKRVAWSLNQCWYKLKRDAIVKKAKDSRQFRQLQLHRQEQQHFVKVMQGYMASQIIQVTWRELQQALDSDVHSLDDLRRVHNDYLHKALFRCLLNKKAAPIMKIIQDIFCLILKFCAQLNSATWEQDPTTGEVTHPNFAAMVASYKAFKEYFVFLFKVVNKLAVRGYQPHLHELLLRLNFNDYYTTK